MEVVYYPPLFNGFGWNLELWVHIKFWFVSIQQKPV